MTSTERLDMIDVMCITSKGKERLRENGLGSANSVGFFEKADPGTPRASLFFFTRT